MRSHVIFQDKKTFDYYTVSVNALDYIEYEEMERRGFYKKIFNGSKRECLQYLENENVEQ